MVTMVRALGFILDSDIKPLPIPYTGINGCSLATQPRIDMPLSRDLSGNNVALTKFGAGELLFSPGYVRGGRTARMRFDYAPVKNESRTMCVVARLAPGLDGSAFFIGDFTNPRGCTIFSSRSNGWRAQVNIETATGTMRTLFPTVLPGLPAGIVSDWAFVALVIDAAARKATLYLPGHSYQLSYSWVSGEVISQGTEYLLVAGGEAATEESSDVAYATYHNRALTASEITQQYAVIKSNCQPMGISI